MSGVDRRPLIGLSTYREPARWGVWDQRADLLPTSYAEMVLAAGGVPVLLPPSAPYDVCAREVVARLDGLVVTGGADVDPTSYGEVPGAATDVARPDRDAWEVALLDAAEERRLATLGVCRGMQVMAVRAGGSLDQHLPDLVGHERHSPGADAFGTTVVRLDPGVPAFAGEERVEVRCHHHQAVRDHPGFTVVGRSGDGVIEAIQETGQEAGQETGQQTGQQTGHGRRGRFCLAVQWHPEVGDDLRVFRSLVLAAGCGDAVRTDSPPT